MSDQKPPVAHAPISVNVDDWLKQRTQGPPQVSITVEEAAEQVATLSHDMLILEHERQLAVELDSVARECVECGDTRKHFKDDYMCWQCREARD